ncbi:hypothetical protein FOZ61_010785 [Perkinsus olseni]|uniref:Uncharacterized protein n=1 Tax=Perkinsus olseni TaxID=32597 RepID=A0A7J6M293_PEROL|nr:hypothetical protein FOZ61_010785 [Perkinsus olseni]KAF4672334.1 hypothetical protein FOL46_009162 [Perkinsus olseni]
MYEASMLQYLENSEAFDADPDLDSTIMAVGEGGLSLATAFSLQFRDSGTITNAGSIGAARFSGPSAFAFVGPDNILFEWHPVLHLSVVYDAGSIGSLLAMRVSLDMLPLSQQLRRHIGDFSNSHFFVTNEIGQVLASTDDPAAYMSPAAADDGSTQLSFQRIWEVLPAVKREYFLDLLRSAERVTVESDDIRIDLEIAVSSGAPLILVAITSIGDFRDAALASMAVMQVLLAFIPSIILLAQWVWKRHKGRLVEQLDSSSK